MIIQESPDETLTGNAADLKPPYHNSVQGALSEINLWEKL